MRKCRNCLCRTCIKSCKCHNCKGKIKECKRYRDFRQLSIFGTAPKGKMRVLVACEESQRVCIEFCRLGHEAYSCDIQECSGGHQEWHIQGDVLSLLNGKCTFQTMDGKTHSIDGKWDLIIAHPPCTYLSNAGARFLYPKGKLNDERLQKGLKAKEFFMQLWNADCPRIAVENPIPSKVYGLPEYTQTIQPYEFGHPYSKKTCLWLKGLSKLQPTEIVPEEERQSTKIAGNWFNKGGKDRQKNRAKTFSGIAKAMAEQWGKTEEPPEPKYQKAPRHPWSYYDISKERYKQLTEYIRSGEYASIASQAAHRANKMLSSYIIMSIEKNLSYEGLERLWQLKEIERMACGRSDFYGWRREFYGLFNEKIKEMGK